MAKISKILFVEQKVAQITGEKYEVSHVLLEDGTEASGWGRFKVGQKVEAYFDERYNRAKISNGGQHGYGKK